MNEVPSEHAEAILIQRQAIVHIVPQAALNDYIHFHVFPPPCTQLLSITVCLSISVG